MGTFWLYVAEVMNPSFCAELTLTVYANVRTLSPNFGK